MNESYVSLSKFQEPCCRPMSIQIIWLLLWTSLSKCPDVLLWLSTYPSTIFVAEDAKVHANSTSGHQIFYTIMGINIHPRCIQILCLSCLLLAIPCCCGLMPKYFWCCLGRNAFTFHVCRFDSMSISVVVGQHPPNDYICRYGICRPRI